MTSVCDTSKLIDLSIFRLTHLYAGKEQSSDMSISTKVGKKAVNTHIDTAVKTDLNLSLLVDWWAIEVVDWVN